MCEAGVGCEDCVGKVGVRWGLCIGGWGRVWVCMFRVVGVVGRMVGRDEFRIMVWVDCMTKQGNLIFVRCKDTFLQ